MANQKRVYNLSTGRVEVSELAHTEPTADEIAEELSEKAGEVRAKRNRLLADTDHMMLPDSPHKDDKSLVAYRQALRDLSEQEGFPITVAWPTKPEGA